FVSILRSRVLRSQDQLPTPPPIQRRARKGGLSRRSLSAATAPQPALGGGRGRDLRLRLPRREIVQRSLDRGQQQPPELPKPLPPCSAAGEGGRPSRGGRRTRGRQRQLR